MTDRQTDTPGRSRAGIVFFGRIMANVSHEFNNVITVISELAGLLKDLSLMAQQGREIQPKKVLSISENIAKQVARGKHLTSHMNRFSHSADEDCTGVDMQGVVENMMVLTDRLFKNRKSSIDFAPPEEACNLHTDPFELRRILSACLDCFLNASSPEVSVTLKRLDEKGTVELCMGGPQGEISQDFSAQIEELKRQTADLKGQLIFEQEDHRLLFRLMLPSTRE